MEDQPSPAPQAEGMESPRRDVLDLASDPHMSKFVMFVGKLITRRPIKHAAIHNILKVAWASYDTVEIVDLRENVNAQV